jgi:hypothetical protein
MRVAGRGGVVLQIDAITSAVLLPNVESEEALERLHAGFGKPCCVEVDDADEDVVLVPDFALKTVDGPALSFERVYDALCRQIENARVKARQRQDYLQRKRESHTRPMDLTPMSDLARDPVIAAGTEPYPRMPATIAMGLQPTR